MLLRIEKYIFYIFLFSIPFQTRKILYFDGWRFNEWLSVSLYATDILLLVLFGFWAYSVLPEKYKVASSKYHGKENSKKPLLRTTYYVLQKSDFYLIAFLIISAISIKNSDNQIIGWYQWVKLVEFTVFYWYLSSYAFKKFGLLNSFLAIFLSGIFQAVVAIIQFLKQSNIGLKYLGESVINNDFSGVASFYLTALPAQAGQSGVSETEKIIRAYGTTPHPNVLAVFLLLSLFAFYFIYLYSRLHSEHSPQEDYWDKSFLGFSGVILFAFFTTFSRTVIFIWFVTFCARGIAIVSRKHYRIIFGTPNARTRIRAILLVSLFVILLFGSLYFRESISRLTISGDDQAIELRSFYAKEAFKANINFFGIGHGNFMSWLIKENPFLPAYAYQPVHNVFLLIYAETGVLGISAFILFLLFLVKDFILKTKLNKSYYLSFLFLFCALIFISFFDHMFWTLQSGRLVFWFSLALLTYSKNSDIISE